MLSILQSRFAAALSGMTDDVDAALQLIRPAQDAKFGDYQANMSMSLGKSLKKSPRDVAAEIVARLQIDDICEPCEIAGPGFINLRFKSDAIAAQIEKIARDPERFGVAQSSDPRTIVIDYSAPNIAKAMHVGHIRSTVIGNALARMLRFCGHRVITDNHIGDWGTQFGMMIYGFRNWLDAAAYAENPSAELTRLYRLVREKIDVEKDSALAAAVLAETAKLHHGDADNVALWKSIVDTCRRDIDRIYERLDITFDYTLGESFYSEALPELVARLLATGVARESDGAAAIFFGDGDDETPMLVRKKDGAFLYGTTDLATIEYRLREWRPHAILYVVDFRQSLHFEHLFAAAKMIGVHAPKSVKISSDETGAAHRGRGTTEGEAYKSPRDGACELLHIKFGTVLGDDGKPFKTRSGDAVGLESLLDEAEERAMSVVAASENVKSMSDDAREEIARRVGLGALVYADLAQNRESDYVFSYDKMLSMNGNTATYIQYACARILSIFARGGVDADALRTGGARVVFTQTEERALALALLQFGDAIDAALRDYRPHTLTAYLFELANRYSTFFEKCPVLKAESDAVRDSRLVLCDLTARTLQKGLDLLGIKTVERM